MRALSMRWLWLAIMLFGAANCNCEDIPAQEEQTVSAISFTIWRTHDAPQDEEILGAFLRQEGNATVDICRNPKDWIRSDADVLVLRGAVNAQPTPPSPQDAIDEGDLRILRRRRVIGIGVEAGRALGALGLDISEGSCADFRDRAPAVRLGRGPTVPAQFAGNQIRAFDTSRLPGSGELSSSLAMYLPTRSALATQVEALARWESAPNYAPIVRQGMMILWGIAVDARAWTEDLSVVFRRVALCLGHEEACTSALSEWHITAPGQFEFELAPARSTKIACDRSFYFRFLQPTVFSADLEVEGGRVRLFFRGQVSKRGASLVDVRAGKRVRFIQPLTERYLADNDGRYWVLDVSNLDGYSPVKCALRVGYDDNVEFRFPTGLVATLSNPPSDEGAIEDLVRFACGEDVVLAAEASAVLKIVGAAAIPALRRASRALLHDDPLEPVRVMKRLAIERLLDEIQWR